MTTEILLVIAYSLLEYWLGKTSLVKQNSLIDLILSIIIKLLNRGKNGNG